MHTTSVSLLERLRDPREQFSWQRFVEIYTPLLYFWARQTGLQETDAADLVQDVFAILVKKLPEFVYDCNKSFRGWLRTVLANKWRDRQRQIAAAPRIHGSDALMNEACIGETDAFWEIEYRQHLVGRALELMQSEFQRTTWRACWEVVVSGRSATDVATELGISVESVYAAKSRVLRRLRKELEGLLD